MNKEDHIEFLKDCLDYHNVIRKAYGAPPIKLSAQLCKEASQRAYLYSKSKTFDIDENIIDISENVLTINGNVLDASMIIGHWLAEEQHFNFQKLQFQIEAARFSTMIWIGVKEFGIGFFLTDDKQKLYVVARYTPAANYHGAFKYNILPLGSKIAKRPGQRKLPISKIPEFDKIEQFFVKMHNTVRKQHSAPALSWSRELAQKASKYAGELLSARLNKLEDPMPPLKYGHNVLICGGGIPSMKDIFSFWLTSTKPYDFDYNEYQSSSASFTQIIWKGSEKLGVGMTKKGDKFVCVALYDPSGNIVDRFEKNVASASTEDEE